MISEEHQLFLSYAGEDAFEASLLQYALENLLAEFPVRVWSYHRDQVSSQRSIAGSLKERVRGSVATVFLVSPGTMASGATQWMELAYSDAFEVPTFVLLHHITYAELRSREKGVPPLLLEGQCTGAQDWRRVTEDIRKCCRARRASTNRR
jgi:hypothetical protein